MTLYLEPFGFWARSEIDWQKGSENPDLQLCLAAMDQFSLFEWQSLNNSI